MKASELEGVALDAWVARAEGYDVPSTDIPIQLREGEWFFPSSDWLTGGPIIHRERIGFFQSAEWIRDIDKSKGVPYTITIREPEVFEWAAAVDGRPDYGTSFGATCYYGPTPLIAAMRAYVADKFGDDLPELQP